MFACVAMSRIACRTGVAKGRIVADDPHRHPTRCETTSEWVRVALRPCASRAPSKCETLSDHVRATQIPRKSTSDCVRAGLPPCARQPPTLCAPASESVRAGQNPCQSTSDHVRDALRPSVHCSPTRCESIPNRMQTGIPPPFARAQSDTGFPACETPGARPRKAVSPFTAARPCTICSQAIPADIRPHLQPPRQMIRNLKAELLPRVFFAGEKLPNMRVVDEEIQHARCRLRCPRPRETCGPLYGRIPHAHDDLRPPSSRPSHQQRPPAPTAQPERTSRLVSHHHRRNTAAQTPPRRG